MGDLNSRIGDFSPKSPPKKAVILQHKIEQFNRSNQGNRLGDLNSRIGDFSPKSPPKKAVILQHKNLKTMEDLLEQLSDLIAQKVVEKMESTSKAFEQVPENHQEDLTIDELVEKLRISKPTVFRHRKSGLLTPSYYVGRSPRFTPEDIERYLKNFKNQ